MHQLLATSNEVTISAVTALLAAAQISCFVADRNISVLEGSIGIFPRRILVDGDDLARARRLLREAGFGADLS